MDKAAQGHGGEIKSGFPKAEKPQPQHLLECMDGLPFSTGSVLLSLALKSYFRYLSPMAWRVGITVLGKKV